jgi:prophage regulatory protein
MPQQILEREQRRLRRVLRLPEVERVTGRTRSTIYDDIARGAFPKPIHIGPRASAWLEDEVIAWQEQRIAERDAETAVRSLPLRGRGANSRRRRRLSEARDATHST